MYIVKLVNQIQEVQLSQKQKEEIYMTLQEMPLNGHLSMLPITAALLALHVGAISTLQARPLRPLTVASAIRPFRTTPIGFRVALY